MDALEAGRAALAIVLMAWLPGRVWVFAVMSDLDRTERFVFSVGLSVALMVLALYLGSVALGIAISATHAVGWSLFLTLAGVATAVWRRSWGAAPADRP